MRPVALGHPAVGEVSLFRTIMVVGRPEQPDHEADEGEHARSDENHDEWIHGEHFTRAQCKNRAVLDGEVGGQNTLSISSNAIEPLQGGDPSGRLYTDLARVNQSVMVGNHERTSFR